MKVLQNNCVSSIEIPSKVESAHGFDYNPVLDLCATFNYYDGVSVWNPITRQVVAEFEGLGENFRDTLFLPGNRVGISSAEYYSGGLIEIYTLGKDKSERFEIDDDSSTGISMPACPGALALSPEKNLLVSDPFTTRNSCGGVHEIVMDWDDLEALRSRQIIPGDELAEYGVWLLCCSQDFEVSTCVGNSLSTAKVWFDTESEVRLDKQETITYYMLDGEEGSIYGDITGLAHDGQNLIIAHGEEIVLLESMTEGSNAHLIASDITPSGQMRINHEGQLMVCEEKVIKLFEYSCNPRSLQEFCRCSFRKAVHTDYHDKVDSLAIPYMLKNYLLYK